MIHVQRTMLKKSIRITSQSHRVLPARRGQIQQKAAEGIPVPGLPPVASLDREVLSRRSVRVRSAQRVIIVTSRASIASPAKKEHYSHAKPPNYEVASKKEEYWRFVDWSATFKPLRKPSSQAELAKEMGVDAARLSEWKWMPKFHEDVWKRVIGMIEGGSLADAFHGWMARLPETGRAADMKLLLEWLKGFKSKETHEVNVRLETFIESQTKRLMDAKPTMPAVYEQQERKRYL
jgi:hypothetical protein